MSLRERNKIKRHNSMVDAAIKLFENDGFDSTRLEDVAELAEVSPATLYNYFPTKGHLIAEIYKNNMQKIHDEQIKIIENPPENPVDAIIKMYSVDMEGMFNYKNRQVWKEIYSTAIAFQTETVDVVNPLSNFRTNKYIKLLEKLQNKGSISAKANIESLAEILSSLNEAHFLSRLINRKVAFKDILPRLKRNVETVLSTENSI